MTSPNPMYLPAFSTCLQPLQTPFEQLGQGQGTFIYLTARYQRWSYLMQGTPPTDELYDTIEMGRTDLWILEKRFAAAPEPGLMGFATWLDKAQRLELPQAEWPGKVFVLLREPGTDGTRDVVNPHLDENAACNEAQAYANVTGRRALVGLLWSSLFWD